MVEVGAAMSPVYDVTLYAEGGTVRKIVEAEDEYDAEDAVRDYAVTWGKVEWELESAIETKDAPTL